MRCDRCQQRCAGSWSHWTVQHMTESPPSRRVPDARWNLCAQCTALVAAVLAVVDEFDLEPPAALRRPH